MSPRQISEMYADVTRAHHATVALDTHSRLLATAASFGGDKSGQLEKFYARLAEEDQSAAVEARPVSIAELVLLGRQTAAEQAGEDEFTRAEREAEEALKLELFAKHRAKAVPK